MRCLFQRSDSGFLPQIECLVVLLTCWLSHICHQFDSRVTEVFESAGYVAVRAPSTATLAAASTSSSAALLSAAGPLATNTIAGEEPDVTPPPFERFNVFSQ